MDKYNHQNIDKKWQDYWDKEKTYETSEDKSKPKYYVLDMFPYPSGSGLHVGHVKGYSATDILSRYKKMAGFNVLHPMGWDAFGLPAENYALENKVHPKVCTQNNIAYFKNQLKSLGFSYDWSREINTTDPEYYKWTQWAFIKMWERGLVYESREPIIWCPSCQTGLAMEDLEDGKCERCKSEIERKPMRQWVIKITDYADRLLNDIDKLSGWEDSIKEMQRNWIGRSEGAEINFQIKNSPLSITAEAGQGGVDGGSRRGGSSQTGCVSDAENKLTVFTTRPDTLFGCTYCVVAPEHPLIKNEELRIKNLEEVNRYIEQAKKKTDLQRTDLNKDKSGVKLEGIVAINPANGEEVPIFIADYVLANYGTGAIMAVPAHDERDFEFAKKYDLPIKTVVTTDKKNVIGIGVMIETKDGKFLFQRRDKKTDKNPGMLVFFGGGIENNESTEETLRREIKEELNLEIKEGNFSLINKIEGHNFPGKFLEIFYVKNVDEENMKLGEGEAIEKLSLDEALNSNDITPFTKNVIKYLWEKKCFTEAGVSVNSDFLNGLITAEAKTKMIAWLEENNFGKKRVNYKLNDWVFSRQRYWGEPIPFVHCEKCGAVPVAEKDLPVRLPEVEHYEPTGTGESPLANIYEWVNTTCPKCGGAAKRETNTMPQWAGSSWYYLRYIDPKNDQALIDKDKEKYWSPVDFYVGGAEHATRHLIYARFWHKFLYDIGVVNYEEPFTRLQHVGLVMGSDGQKISKRLKNGANPMDVAAEFGADALRVYEMFMGPFGAAGVWNTNGLVGARKFLDRIWNIADLYCHPERSVNEVKDLPQSKQNEQSFSSCHSERSEAESRNPFQFKQGEQFFSEKKSDKVVKNLLHKTIKKVGEDIAEFKFNTAISQMMIFLNGLEEFTSPLPPPLNLPLGQGEKTSHKGEGARIPSPLQGEGQDEVDIFNSKDFGKFIQILAPFAPHIAEEIWEKLGNKESIFNSAWPKYDPEFIKDETINLVVQINGKLRATISVSADISEDEAKKIAQENEAIKKWTEGKEIIKIIFVKGKLVNIVVKV